MLLVTTFFQLLFREIMRNALILKVVPKSEAAQLTILGMRMTSYSRLTTSQHYSLVDKVNLANAPAGPYFNAKTKVMKILRNALLMIKLTLQ